MYYKSEDIDKLIDELNIEDVVGEFVDLKKSGANYKGLCPFHADTNPSFVVNPSKNICKCFVCGAGGNAVTFYSKYKKISFGEAVKELAKKYNVNIKEQKSTSKDEELEKYYEIMEESHKFFMEKIFTLEARVALDYLGNRGLNTKLIKEYQLGYAPAKWDELYNYLLEKGYTTDDIYELGLIKKGNDRNYDSFRNRIIYPIYSNHGRVIAFGGRTLEIDDKTPKYINSPDTPIFKKGKNIYGMERARNIKEKNYSILMEGYMDVLSACIYGFDTSIAPLGTALTEDQAKLIKRYSSNVLLSFDMDKAGVAATERAAYILKMEGFNIRVLQFEGGKDPDEYLKKNGRDGFLKIVKNSIEIFDFLYNLFLSEYDLKDVISKQNFIEKFREFFSSINNELEKEIYLKRLSEKVDISPEILKKTLILENKKKKNYTEIKDKKEEEISKSNNTYDIEKSIIKMLLRNPIYYSFFQNKQMEYELTNKIFKFFENKLKENLILNSNNIVKELKKYVENNLEFSEKEKNVEIVELFMDYLSEEVNFETEKKNLEIFKSYFRYRIKNRNKGKDTLLKKFKIGNFQRKIEESKTIDEFTKIYNINENLLD